MLFAVGAGMYIYSEIGKNTFCKSGFLAKLQLDLIAQLIDLQSFASCPTCAGLQ